MRTLKELPLLFGKAKGGKVKQWQISVVVSDDGTISLRTVSGFRDGKQTESLREVEGKNIGRANETSTQSQAESEATSRWNAKKDDNYVEHIEELDNGPTNLLPMLAQRFQDMKHRIKYPCYVQPKLNGIRCMAPTSQNQVEYISRGGKQIFTLGHLDHQLMALITKPDTTITFDGEIYCHGMTFQEITTAFKKVREGTEKLQYWVYDVVDTEQDFEGRLEVLTEFIGFKDVGSEDIIIVPTYIVNNEQEVMDYFKQFVLAGYEGVIIRNAEGVYEMEKRSFNLQKYKEMQDAEYKIVGARAASGTQAGCIVFICEVQLRDGTMDTFECVPKGTLEERREMMDNKDSYIGKMLTVQYQCLSDDDVPIFPVGLTVRDYE